MIWALLALLPAAVLVLLGALLVLPLRLRALLTGARLRVDLGLFGLPPRLTVYDSAVAHPAPEPGVRGPLRRKKRRVPARLLEQMPRAALEIVRRIRVHVCRVVLRVGLGDPAATGVLYGRLAPLAAVRWALPARAVLIVTPDFDQAVFEGEGELALSLVPARLVPLAARLLWSLRR